MKIIHCADIHLGSKLDSRLPADKAEERRGEVRATFGKMVQYAKDEGVSVIMLSGDVFDSDRPVKKDKQFFYDVVRATPQIDFLYLRGNHDLKEAYTEQLPNLKTFSKDWTGYKYENVAIYGIELLPENCLSLYSTLSLNPRNVNIVMLHGQAGDRAGEQDINLLRLADKYIDYLALGHIHSLKSGRLDGRGVYAYSGCLEGRGFDEIGEKGFILLDIADKITSKFIPFCKREIRQYTVDISSAANAYEGYLLVKEGVEGDKKNLLRIILRGAIVFDNYRLKEDIQEQLTGEYYFVSVKDETERRLDLTKLSQEISLKGEFVRCVLSSTEYDDGQKQAIISAGLKALEGRGEEI